MKKLHLISAMLSLFVMLYARGATTDAKSAPAASTPAVAAAPVDPKLAELQAKIDTLTVQLDNANKGMRAIQEQRNTIAGQLLDAQANIQLFQGVFAEKDAQIAELKKKAGDRPPEPVPPAPSSAPAVTPPAGK